MARAVVLHVHVRQGSHPEGACPEPGRAGESLQERSGAGCAIFPLVLRHDAEVRDVWERAQTLLIVSLGNKQPGSKVWLVSTAVVHWQSVPGIE